MLGAAAAIGAGAIAEYDDDDDDDDEDDGGEDGDHGGQGDQTHRVCKLAGLP